MPPNCAWWTGATSSPTRRGPCATSSSTAPASTWPSGAAAARAHETLGGDAALEVADTHVSEELIRVSEALRELEAIDPELAELVDMRYFGGYSEAEIAELQGITDRTVRRRWDKARAWLYVALSESPLPPPTS